MPYGSAEEPDIELVEAPAFAVRVVSSDAKPGKAVAPEFARWRTILVSNVQGPNSITSGAQRLFNRSLRRHRGHIFVLPTITAQTSTDGVILGSREEIASGQPAVPGQLGGFLPIGVSVRWEGQAELWVCYPSTNAAAVYVTTCDEQYASDSEAYKGSER